MPTNKNFYLRSMVIDRLLRTENGSSASEILEKVNQVLVEIGLHPLKRRDTILNDILEIENRHHVRVITWKDKDDKRIIRYRYEKLSFSIYNYPLTPQQVEDIKGALNLLMTFKGMPQYKWVEQLCSHFAVANEPLGNKVVHFEESCCDKGKEFFTPLFHAILEHKAVTITHQKFGCNEKQHTIFPYYLKQVSCRWYLIARCDSHLDSTCKFSLDRITSVRVADDVEYVPSGMDIDEFFRDVYGITRPDNVSPITICFHVKAKDLPFLLTKPIHQSQTVIKNDTTGAILSIHVIPNYELMMRFLSYGDSLMVLTKCKLRDDIIVTIKNMLKKYESSK